MPQAEKKESPKPKPKPKLQKLPGKVDVVYSGPGAIVHHSTDPNARDDGGNPVKYIFNPGVPVTIEIPYDIAKFCHLAWISNPSDWEALQVGTDKPVEPLEKIPYPPHPAER